MSSSHSIIVRQLDSSPSQNRRYNTINTSTYRSYNNGNRNFDSNSNFEVSNENVYKYGYNQSLSSRLSYTPNGTPQLSSKEVINKSFNTINSIADFDKKSKTSLDTLNDHFANSKSINNYFSLSDIRDNDCVSTTSLYKSVAKPCDRYGFFIDSDEEYESKTPTTQQLKEIRLKEKKWLQMLNNWKYYINFKWDKIRDRCRKGIPHSLRSKAWFHLCGAHIQKKRHPRLFGDLLELEPPEDVKNEISKDLDRQFPNHELFADQNSNGQADLYNVLKAFAVHKPKIGYCQAQGPIAAVLLMHMPAENAFWTLVALNNYYIGGYFAHNLEDIKIHGQMLFSFLKKYSPRAHNLLKRQDIEPILYMTEWFMCIYSRNLPWPSVLRVWDMFLCEGVAILFKVGIYLIDVSLRNENIKTCPTMYETCQKLRNIPKHFLTEEILMKGIKKIDLDNSDLLKEHRVQLKKFQKSKNKK